MRSATRLAPRWSKVLRDLFANKTRTALVVLSIAVGVFAVGVVINTQDLLTREMSRNWLSTYPSSAQLTLTPFGQDFVQSVAAMPEVEAAEGRSVVWARVSSNEDARVLQLRAIQDFDDMQVGKVFADVVDKSSWPPARREILLERNTLGLLGVEVGDTIELEMPNAQKYRLRVAGSVHDPAEPGQAFLQTGSGYVSMETMAWLGQPNQFNTLLIRVAEQQADHDHVQQVADLIKDRVQKSGGLLLAADVPDNPGRHPLDEAVQAVLLVMSVLGALSLVMSGFLVVNTVSAVMAEQVRQIGMMKAIGARSYQLTDMYVVMVLAFGGLSLLLALPLGGLATRAFVGFLAGLLNLNLAGYATPIRVVLLELAIGLIAPLLAAIQPIRSSTRRTVREAVNDYGLAGGATGNNAGARHWRNTVQSGLAYLSRPLMLSLRNTFRRKGRLLMTMATLILGGAIFIAVFSVRESLLQTLDVALNYWNYDVEVNLAAAYPSEQVERAAKAVPGVLKAEAWGFADARRIYEDRSEGLGLIIVAPPAETELLRPILLRGRWLQPDDQDAVVVNTELTAVEEDIALGDVIQLKVNGTARTALRVVGIVQGVMTGRIAYVNKPYFSNKIVMTGNKAQNLQLLAQRHDPVSQNEIAQALKEEFKRANIRVGSTSTTSTLRLALLNQFNVIIVFLLIMAVLIAIVGGLGLAGTMSISVLERTREIGVMRAIGATSHKVRRIVVVEGVVIGLLSWLIGAALAVPISALLSDAIGALLLQQPLFYRFGWWGVAIWLGLVIAISALASSLPALRASRLTVREVLAYS